MTFAICLMFASVGGSTEKIFTSTRHVTAMAADGRGGLWAGTTGGVLYTRNGVWLKFTRMDGLPSHEALAVRVTPAGPRISFPTRDALRVGGRWQIVSKQAHPAAATVWRTHKVVATPEGLRIAGRRTIQPYPPTKGSHITAMLPRPQELWIAWYGDGVWIYSNKRWTRPKTDLPKRAHQVTCMAEGGGRIWVGTRREGIWEFDGAKWTNHIYPGEPYQHNIQAFWEYGGKMWASTLEDGLVSLDDDGWAHTQSPTISSNAPRQAAIWQSRAFLRHGNGAVDMLNANVWSKDALRPFLPRKEASALAADAQRLYVAQYGGWTEFAKEGWISFLTLPVLTTTPVTAVEPAQNRLLIGTQGKGLAVFDRSSLSLSWQNERQGFTDDWITAMASDTNNFYLGTFVGGLLTGKPNAWKNSLAGENVTAIAASAKATYIASRRGLWKLAGDKLEPVRRPWLDTEVQCLLHTKAGLWVGTRTGLFLLAKE